MLRALWEIPARDAIGLLNSSDGGLTTKQAAVILDRVGPNMLDSADEQSSWVLVGRQFISPIVLILLAAPSWDLRPCSVQAQGGIVKYMTDTELNIHESGRTVFTEFAVGWDGSPPSRAALDWVVERAGRGEITLVHVAEETSHSTGFLVHDASTRAERSELDAEVGRIAAELPDARITGEMVLGDAAEELRRYATPKRVVAVGTTPRHGSEGRYRWSVGSRLAASADGPIAIIPQATETTHAGVVVGVDGTDSSAAAILFAAAEVQRSGQTLYMVHAWMEPPQWEDVYMPDNRFLLSLEDMHREVLDRAVDDVRSRFPEIDVVPLLKRALPHEALLQASGAAGLLVVGNHGLHGIRRLLLGSVSHAVLLGLRSPTVVVPAPSDK